MPVQQTTQPRSNCEPVAMARAGWRDEPVAANQRADALAVRNTPVAVVLAIAFAQSMAGARISAACIPRGIVIGGPTGVGKTDLAVLLAQRLGGELISCDSVQVFTGLHIGANKTPTPVPQHLLDVRHWRESFTAADFYREAWAAVKDVVQRGRVPILVGGTGFYLDWMLRGRPGAPPSDPVVLARIEARIGQDANWEASLARLQAVDGEYAAGLSPNDYYRLKRALAVFEQTGRPLSSFRDRRHEPALHIDWRCFYLTSRDRCALLRRIDRRCEEMVRAGLVDEVMALMREGFDSECQAGKSIGYQETLSFVARLRELPPSERTAAGADASFVHFLRHFQSETRQYTRRQEKWFYAMPMFHWVERASLEADLSSELVETVVELYNLAPAEATIQHPLIAASLAFREQCRGDSPQCRDRRKRLRTYQSQFALFAEAQTRADFLEPILISSLNANGQY